MAGEDERGVKKSADAPRKIDRRDVLKGLSTVPALGLFGYAWQTQRKYQQTKAEEAAAPPEAPKDLQVINVALLGAGAQGQVLTDSMLRIPGLRFRAVCDIWEEYNQKRVVNTFRKFKHEVNAYEDYREMLDKEKELDAVIVATPDFWHAQHAGDCLKAGKHVYCEKEMSNTLDGARSMVLAQRETGKLLQIGHQRRSNPRYLHCYNKLITEAKLLGRIVTVSGQWNRALTPDLGAPDRYAIPQARLTQFGFKDMHQFRNWRWYKGKGGGPIVDLGSHQIDIYSWFLGDEPFARDGERRQPLSRSRDARVGRHGDGGLRLRHSARRRESLLPDADDQRQPGLLRELHGRPGHAAHVGIGDELPGHALSRSERARLGRVGAEGLRHGAEGAGDEAEEPRAPLRTCASRSPPISTCCR